MRLNTRYPHLSFIIYNLPYVYFAVIPHTRVSPSTLLLVASRPQKGRGSGFYKFPIAINPQFDLHLILI